MNKKIQTLIFTTALLLFLSSPSIAVIDDYQDAVDAYSREDYKTAFNLKTKKYQDGLDAFNKKDYKTAHQLFFWLAEQGVAKAQYNLGLMYGKGKGVKRDYKEAVRWYLRAAEKGYSKAQTNLGRKSDEGGGVPKLGQKPVMW